MGSQKIIIERNERFIIHIRTTNRNEILNGGADERSVAGENQTGTAGRYFSTVFTAARTLYFFIQIFNQGDHGPVAGRGSCTGHHGQMYGEDQHL
ncbi:hypothetical protein D3C78_1770610 [compost metagenome]